jgi:hypothetical protein
MDKEVRAAVRAKMAQDEAMIRGLLGRWVSGLEPAIVMRGAEVIGLCVADTMVGEKPFILLPDRNT